MEQALPNNIVLFGCQISPIIMTDLRIVLIVVVGRIILTIIQKLIRTFRAHLAQNYQKNPEEVKHAAPTFSSKILEDIEIAGVNESGDLAVISRCRFKVIPIEQWGVRREYLRRTEVCFRRCRYRDSLFSSYTLCRSAQGWFKSALYFNLSRDTGTQLSRDSNEKPGGVR